MCAGFGAAKMSGPTLAIVLGAIAILIFCSALFSRVETALSLLKPHQLRRLEAESCGADEFHTALPRKSAPRFECAASGRRISQRASGHIVSFLSVGRPACRARSAMVGRHSDLRHRGVALRSGAETGGARGALEAFGHRRFHLANRDAVSRSHRPRTRDR